MERSVELQGSLASQTSPDCELQIQRENLSQENKVESNREGHLTRTSGLHMHKHAQLSALVHMYTRTQQTTGFYLSTPTKDFTAVTATWKRNSPKSLAVFCEPKRKIDEKTM